MLLFLALWAANNISEWAYRLGGPGLVLLALVDNSVVPLPGGMDAATILLAAREPEWWWYYALWATAGSVLGGWLTFRVARKGGKELLEKKIPKRAAERSYRIFGRYGFNSIFIGTLLPPPIPLVPILLTAGCMQYSTRRFLAALTLGRAIRYTLVAWLGAQYGRLIFGWLSPYYKPIFWTLIGLAVIGSTAGVWWLRKKKREGALDKSPQEAREAA